MTQLFSHIVENLPLWIVVIPFIGIAFPLLLDRFGRLACTLAAAVPAIASISLLFSQMRNTLDGDILVWSMTKPWIPMLNLNISFRIDGLGFLFALLILGIGLLVILYAHYYLSNKDPIGRFYATLLAFMGAMLGVVLSENLVLLALFWEITSLSSFLLIGYWSDKAAARQGARMALTVTGLGGLCLFAGVLLLGHIVGSFELTTVLASKELIQSHELYLPMLVLVLLGAFTKSAQFPFHFWLPNAMTAPTPVSSYLHSATMVKAGVFLLARLHPALAGSMEWFVIVTSAGLMTLSFAAYVALYKHDLKGLLAYSTISHLGLITVLFGFGTKVAAIVGVFHIMNHAAFKASLFMTAGIIDHETGTRDIRILGGLKKLMPLTMVLGTLGAAAMAGVPFFNGFLSKELFFAETLELEALAHIPWLVPTIATLAGLFSVAYSIRFVHGVFWGELGETPRKAHDPPNGMLLPVAVLVAICLIVGIVPSVVKPLLDVAAGAVVMGEMPYYGLYLWHGFNLPLLMSALAFVGGGIVYSQRSKLYLMAEKVWPANLTGKNVFETSVVRFVHIANVVSGRLENGSLQRYIALLITMTVVAGTVPFVQNGIIPGSNKMQPLELISTVYWVILVVGAIGTVLFHHRRIVATIVVGIVGLAMSQMFVHFSGPDLALTQISVEVVTVLLILLALYVLPKHTPSEGGFNIRKGRDAALAILAGLGAGILSWLIMLRPQSSISAFHLENSTYPVGGGTNVVNVTLVDFRGFDTMGEVAVLAMAALGIFAMLSSFKSDVVQGLVARAQDKYPVMLTSVTRPLLALIFLIAIYIFLRGHNLPGGGFIGGLVATVALIIQFLASGSHWASERMRLNFKWMAVLGVFIAVLSGTVSWFAGAPFLTMAVNLPLPIIGTKEIVSTLIFDLGVFLGVVGAMMVMLSNLGKLSKDETNDETLRIKESNPWKP